ncbi:hypothetical protein J25TS5_04240 [Paenibacillus faecis]|uniref:hypothetical protein n=1 Tax=Paenibacillus faecis TaxID=862114 RepID=UPI001B224D0B|nr:hypothetical protein [Paenibacillus faecis]GIO83492.1 hypothetical protein J25TS5_04240 [Paenibacillus faecis]
MTKQVRDWHKDMNQVSQFMNAMTLHNAPPYEDIEPTEVALHYWLQQYAAEKERADKAEAQIETLERAWRGSKYKLFTAEAREKKLREAVEAMMPGMWDGMRAHFEVVLASLYPKEEEAK